MPDSTVQLHVSTGSTRYDHALAGRLLTDVCARGVDAELDARCVCFAASAPAMIEVVCSDGDHGDTGRAQLVLGTGGGVDAAVDSRTVVDELENRGLLLRKDVVYAAEEEEAVARRLEELGYLG